MIARFWPLLDPRLHIAARPSPLRHRTPHPTQRYAARSGERAAYRSMRVRVGQPDAVGDGVTVSDPVGEAAAARARASLSRFWASP